MSHVFSIEISGNLGLAIEAISFSRSFRSFRFDALAIYFPALFYPPFLIAWSCKVYFLSTAQISVRLLINVLLQFIPACLIRESLTICKRTFNRMDLLKWKAIKIHDPPLYNLHPFLYTPPVFLKTTLPPDDHTSSTSILPGIRPLILISISPLRATTQMNKNNIFMISGLKVHSKDRISEYNKQFVHSVKKK